jgi:putative DNA primase/helicase
LTAPSNHDSPIALLLAKLGGVKPAGHSHWMARCPSHDDKQQSLSINVGTDGRVLMKCHAGCDNRAIVAAIGLTMGALFVPGSKPIFASNRARRLRASRRASDS